MTVFYKSCFYNVYELPDGSWCWIGQNEADACAPIEEAVHGPFSSFEQAVGDARQLHGVVGLEMCVLAR